MLQLQRISPEFHDRYTVTLIGYLPKQGLIVTTPQVHQKVQFIKEGMRFAVRLLDGSNVLGFVSTVTHSATRPYPHLHLSYPEEVETSMVRNAERINSNVPTLVRNSKDRDVEDAWHPALIKDLSMTGARVESIESLGRPGELLVLKFGVDICGEKEQVMLLSEVCNRTAVKDQADPEDSRYSFGLAFKAMNRMQEVVLNNCVLQLKASRL